jgi:oligopeptide/dipeptide ABC transporter ATP-binding protein
MDRNHQTILQTESLSKFFSIKKENHLLSFKSRRSVVKAVNSVNFNVRYGECFAIVGESGSGKTTLGHTIARILDPTAGRIWFEGGDITSFKQKDLKKIRIKMQMVFQDPGSSLNPRKNIESIISLPLKAYFNLSRRERKKRVAELLEMVNLPTEMMVRYPSALSGGQKQRVGIARALVLHPKMLLLDEPTSALDVSVQAKILHLLMDLQKKMNLTYILISHNLSVVKNLSHRIAVMYLGRIMELAETPSLFTKPMHPYTKALLSAIPVVTEKEREMIPEEILLDGEIPSPIDAPETCPFLTRCKEKMEICQNSPCPEMTKLEEGHFVRCFLYQE